MKTKLFSIVWLAIALCAGAAEAKFTRTEDVIYGRKFGTALTLDVVQPEKTNGFGVVLIISGGWFSAHEFIIPAFMQPLLQRGYTVFAVVHGSQPKFSIPEIESDINRAVRFIRTNASRYGIAPDRIGVSGASAGGHLSLMIATRGANGNPDSKDPVERASSEVQAVACFFPPTDFLNYSKEGDDAVGVGILKDFKAAFGPDIDTPEKRQALGRQISPAYHVRSNQPPVLIIHGDADLLVPIRQAEVFAEASKKAGATVRVDVRQGKQHGWPGIENDLEVCADWFDKHLRRLEPKKSS